MDSKIRPLENVYSPEPKKIRKNYYLNDLPIELIEKIFSFFITHEADPEERVKNVMIFNLYKYGTCPIFGIDTADFKIQHIDTIGCIYANMLGMNITLPRSISEEFDRQSLNDYQLFQIKKFIMHKFPQIPSKKYWRHNEFFKKNNSNLNMQNLLMCDALKNSTEKDSFGFCVMQLVRNMPLLTCKMPLIGYKPFDQKVLESKEKMLIQLWDVYFNLNEEIETKKLLDLSKYINQVFKNHNDLSKFHLTYNVCFKYLLYELKKQVQCEIKNRDDIQTLLTSIILLITRSGVEARDLVVEIFEFDNKATAYGDLYFYCLPYLKENIDENMYWATDFIENNVLVKIKYLLELNKNGKIGATTFENFIEFRNAGVENIAVTFINTLDKRNILINLYEENNIKKIEKLFDLCSVESKQNFSFIENLYKVLPYDYFLKELNFFEKNKIIEIWKNKNSNNNKIEPIPLILSGISFDVNNNLLLLLNDDSFIDLLKKEENLSVLLELSSEIFYNHYECSVIYNYLINNKKILMQALDKDPTLLHLIHKFPTDTDIVNLLFNYNIFDDDIYERICHYDFFIEIKSNKIVLKNYFCESNILRHNLLYFLILITDCGDGLLIQYAHESLRDEKELVFMAVGYTPGAYNWASDRLKKDPDIIRAFKSNSK